MKTSKSHHFSTTYHYLSIISPTQQRQKIPFLFKWISLAYLCQNLFRSSWVAGTWSWKAARGHLLRRLHQNQTISLIVTNARKRRITICTKLDFNKRENNKLSIWISKFRIYRTAQNFNEFNVILWTISNRIWKNCHELAPNAVKVEISNIPAWNSNKIWLILLMNIGAQMIYFTPRFVVFSSVMFSGFFSLEIFLENLIIHILHINFDGIWSWDEIFSFKIMEKNNYIIYKKNNDFSQVHWQKYLYQNQLLYAHYFYFLPEKKMNPAEIIIVVTFDILSHLARL